MRFISHGKEIFVVFLRLNLCQMTIKKGERLMVKFLFEKGTMKWQLFNYYINSC